MDFEFTEEQRMLRDSVRKMMAKFATPEYVRRLDREQAFPDELYAEWLKMGLFRMPFPEEYGGLGGNVIDMVIIAEELAYKSFDLFTAYGGPVFCGLNILRKGTEEQKRHWIPKMLSGEVKFSISRSEPDAGSDIETENFTSPSSILGIQSRFCSSVPLRRILRPQNTGPPKAVNRSKLL